MTQFVHITAGRYSIGRDSFREVKDKTFPLVDGNLTNHERGTYIVVDGVPVRGYPKRDFKMFVEPGGYHLTDSDESMDSLSDYAPTAMQDPEDPEIKFTGVPVLRGEDDDVIKARIEERFRIIDKLVWAAVAGKARGLVVSGPPGVGKSHTVEASLENSFADQVQVANLLRSGDVKDGEEPIEQEEVPERPTYRVVSGHVSPMSLYQMLYDYREENCVLTFDDADTVLYEEKSLNLLKKAMNNQGNRRIDWDSRAIEAAGLPTSFDFKGSVIFITNLNFDNPKLLRSSLGAHLKAIISRVYYVDLGIKTVRDLFLRIDQVCNDGDLLVNMGLTKDEAKEVMEFFEENIHKFRELSIRTVEKIAQTRHIDPIDWRMIAKVSTFNPEHQ